MSLARITSFWLASSLVSLLVCPVSLADDNVYEHSRDSEHQAEMDHFRIKRDYTPRLYGNIEKRKELLEHGYRPMEGQEGSLVRSNDYAGSAYKFVAPPPRQRPQSTYIWGQSAAGGYYDASGQLKELVMGDQLYRYGGKFADGTAVPTTPVVCNFQGHVYLPYVVKRN